jgi:hypothetical protein
MILKVKSMQDQISFLAAYRFHLSYFNIEGCGYQSVTGTTTAVPSGATAVLEGALAILASGFPRSLQSKFSDIILIQFPVVHSPIIHVGCSPDTDRHI